MGDLSSPSKVKEILSRYNFRTSKSLGQNFLVDRNIINKIIKTADITHNDLVVEIGPGIGVLTTAMAEHAQRVLAVEVDKKLIPILQETLSAYKNTEVVLGDALEVDFDQLVDQKTEGSNGIRGKGYKLVANLPYYITTPLIMHLLTNGFNLHSLVVMVQKEVAQRMTAVPGNKEYGSLTVAIQYYTEANIDFIVPRTVFYPPPEVDSAVIKLIKREHPPVKVVDEKMFFKIVRAAFGQRRKTLTNALAGSELQIEKSHLLNILHIVNIDPKRRGETLSIGEFASLANAITK